MKRRFYDELYSLTPCLLSTMAKQSASLVWKRHWQKIFVGIVLLGFCFWSMRYLPSADTTDNHTFHSIKDNQHAKILNVFLPNRHKNFPDEKIHPAFGKTLVTLPNKQLQDILQEDKCPACFGKMLCYDFKVGTIKFENVTSGLEGKGVRFGTLAGSPVAIKSLSTKTLFDKLDEFICAEAERKDCDVGQAIHESSIAKEDSFLIKNLRQSPLVKSHLRPVAHTLLLCATDKLIEKFSEFYDENKNGKLDGSERGYLYTSLVINPEPVLLEFFKKTEELWPFPQYKGSCGRVAVVEHGGIPLHHYLSYNWDTRASIAIEIIDIFTRFEHSNPEYVMFYGDIQMDNFAVQLHGRVVIIDLEDIAIVERSSVPQVPETASPITEPCNADCFKAWTLEILASANNDKLLTKACNKMTIYTDYMHSLTCQRLFSDKGSPRTSNKYGRGLLHSPPEGKEVEIERLISECVHETKRGGRRQAVNDLREILSHYVHPSGR